MKDQFSNLVAKVLAGEASDDEKKIMQQMLHESHDNALAYNQLKEYWDANVTRTNNRDNQKFTDELFVKAHIKKEITRSKYRTLYLRVASVAALLFFASTCSLFYLYNRYTPEQLYTYSSQGSAIEYLLQDGTIVKLNKNSSITFQSDYGNKQRNVRLKGEAFFNVKKDSSKPFIVEAFGTKTEVLGTCFNVKTNSENVITTLMEGSVRFKSSDCEEILKPGEEISYNTKTHIYKHYPTDVQFNTAWVSGRFNYSNVTFAQLSEKLEHIYKLKIHIQDQKIANHVLSASFLYGEPLENIFGALKNELGFNYTIKDPTQIYIECKIK